MRDFVDVMWEAIALSDSIVLASVPHKIDDGSEFGMAIQGWRIINLGESKGIITEYDVTIQRI